jgi:hypothetical protein
MKFELELKEVIISTLFHFFKNAEKNEIEPRQALIEVLSALNAGFFVAIDSVRPFTKKEMCDVWNIMTDSIKEGIERKFEGDKDE